MNSLIKYIRDSREELQKVTWPSKEKTINSTILVIVVSVAIAAFLGGLDYGFSKLLDYVLILF
jgi:preprotein translocase subunit SecE